MTDKQPCVAIVYNTTHYIWLMRRNLAIALQEKGYKVIGLAPHDSYVSALREIGVDVIHVPMRMNRNPISDMMLFGRLWLALRKARPDIMLAFTAKPNIYGTLAARANGIPVINNIAGLGSNFIEGGATARIMTFLYRVALRHRGRIFFQNSDDQKSFLDAGIISAAQRHEVIPGSGVDLTHFAAAPLPGGPQPVFLMIARLLRDKGVVEYVEAARRLRQTRPGARFRLLGATGVANRSAIDRASVDAWVAEGVIEYLGTTDDVRPHIAAADCIVLPSYYREGTPRTLLEGAAMARPIITTDSVGCRDTVEDEVTGLLCTPRDVDSLAARLETFCTLPPEARTAMGAAGRARMERLFDERIVIERYMGAIAEVVGG